MKRFYSRFRVALMTFTLGLAVFWFVDGIRNGILEAPVELPKVETEEKVLVVFPENEFFNARGGGSPCD